MKMEIEKSVAILKSDNFPNVFQSIGNNEWNWKDGNMNEEGNWKSKEQFD